MDRRGACLRAEAPLTRLVPADELRVDELLAAIVPALCQALLRSSGLAPRAGPCQQPVLAASDGLRRPRAPAAPAAAASVAAGGGSTPGAAKRCWSSSMKPGCFAGLAGLGAHGCGPCSRSTQRVTSYEYDVSSIGAVRLPRHHARHKAAAAASQASKGEARSQARVATIREAAQRGTAHTLTICPVSFGTEKASGGHDHESS